MSPEVETLDQLLGGAMPLPVIRGLYPDDARFIRGILGLLQAGEVRLIAEDGTEPPRWRWSEILAALDSWGGVQLGITPVGARRIV